MEYTIKGNIGIDDIEDIESTEMDGSDVLLSSSEACVREVIAHTIKGNDDIESTIIEGSDVLIASSEAYVRDVIAHTMKGKEDIESTVMNGSDVLIANTEACVREVIAHTIIGKGEIESTVMGGSDVLNANTEACVREVKYNTIKGKEDIESTVMDGSDVLFASSEACVREVIAHTMKGKEDIESTVMHGREEFLTLVDVAKREIQDSKTKKGEEKYALQCKEFHDMLIEHYRQTQGTVSVSPIWDGHDKPIHNVFVRPNLIHIKIENDGSRRKTDNGVLKYKDLFYKENKLNKRVIIQGEPGMGKSTLLSKFVLDWCEAASPEFQEYIANFSDLETLQGFTFLFHLSLRDSPEIYEVLKMIKSQLIDKMYDGDERKQVYTLLQHIMKTEKIIICMDGLNEWATNLNSDPFPLIATCNKQCVALITTRPWKMVDKRIKDSGIDLLIEVSGIIDKEQLAIFVLKSLQTNNSKSYTEFMSYVEEQKLQHFLASPWLLTLLVSVWINSQHFSGSLCELNCILLDNLFRKATTHEGKFSHAQFRCLKATNFIYPRVEILNSLAKLAFECTFSSGKSLVFSKEKVLESLSQEHLKFSLQAGILSERYISSQQSQFSFLHETVQEFLAAFHIAQSNGISISSIIETMRHVLEISQVFIYLCGLHTEKASTILDSAVYDLQGDISHGLSLYVKGWYDENKISVFHEENTNFFNIVPAKHNETENYDLDSNAQCVSKALLFQSLLIAGFKEAEASDQNVSYLVCNDFIFHEYLHDSELVDLKSMLMNNTSHVRSLILQSYRLQTKEILTVLQMSKACLTRLKIPGHHELYRALCDLKITELVLETYTNVPVLSDVIQYLSMLSYLELKKGNLHDELCVPVALKHFSLYNISFSARYLSRLLVRLSSLDRHIRCDLRDCYVESDNHKTNSAYDGGNMDILVVRRDLLSCDMSRIELFVENGSRALYELLRGTSIGILALITSNDVSFAADILPTLSKLEKLYIWGTYKDRCALQLPPTLQCLSLQEVECSTEWLGGLFIKLSSLQHQVEYNLGNVAVNIGVTEDGPDLTMLAVQRELLSCDMSQVELYIENVSRDLYELLRGTSIGILTLRTTDDVSLAADILPTLSKLEKVYISGTFKDRCAIQLPRTLQCLSLQKVECSAEWLGGLLIKLFLLQHQVECVLCDCSVSKIDTEDGPDATMLAVQRELLSCDMSQVQLYIQNGSRDLYELLCDTSIGVLELATTDDVSIAADILPIFSKLKKLVLWGTLNDRCDIELPRTLQFLSLQEVECSAEWLGGLLIKLSSLQHQVEFHLCDVALNISDTEDGLDATVLAVQRVLTCDMSHVKLYIQNGSRDLYELLCDTSIGVLELATTDDVSIAADILSTLSKLRKLYIWGTFKDRCAIQLPRTLQCLSLKKVECSAEWLGGLLIKLNYLNHHVACVLCDCAVSKSDTKYGLNVTMLTVQRELLSIDMSRITLIVRNGSRELYELLRGTSIETLSLRATDDVSLAADILPTLSNLENLDIWGTFKDRCAIQIPPILRVLSLHRVECSTEWLSSLLIKLSSLKHQVKCQLFDVVVNTSYADDGQDESISVVRKELLSSDFSKLNHRNGSMDLYQLLRGTSS
ncbi:uncharacterized protein LOC127841092 [Dreissena polymorpha]|uniref:NACHT domain-containing protein n=1 Tax=Dreissena polymorpha TaxID=45954 RepID=A0A9D4EN89_DREPO|nr:uncharacterized protein LOC127841092 [Dreissena polymorpha]KAH3782746.1 hypothetical protein DPMN_160665 [Dreissena polymorpha]